jgi:hypothetical protein
MAKHAMRSLDAWMLRTVRRIGCNPRFCALEATLCSLFLVLFALFLIAHLLSAATR